MSQTIQSPDAATALRAAARRTLELEAAIARDPAQFRVLTGDRPTGPLHVGHLFGTLENRVRLQDAGVELLVLVADYQVLTDRAAAQRLPDDVEGQVADYLAAGIDPARATIFAHTQIAALNQLLLPFLSLVSVAEVGRNPTVKAEVAASGGAATSALMFAYPVHQAADILFCRANLVPVGRDQLPHLELTRTIARRFNERYGPFFPEPDALLSRAPLVLGLDGRKMGKSAGNAIALRASADETARLIRRAKTDAERRITYEPDRRPEVSNLVLLAALCRGVAPEAVAEEVGEGGASALKALVTEAVNERLAPVRRRRAEVVRDRAFLRGVLRDGNERARAIAEDTLATVRRLMHTDY
ncbi:MAG: tryptophanyl-tRNA synthetase [Solirubrobacteraceae bacterium]|jgi:tryptophanyl-tRNA synthetase|nr:tryptophanyl-tRNA synthetase [Solirubrobacteraceae bacterium]